MGHLPLKLIPLFLIYFISSHQTKACSNYVTSPPGVDYINSKFYPLAKDQKCFSFQVRGTYAPHLLFSDQQSMNKINRLEVILQYDNVSMIRLKDHSRASVYNSGELINKNEFRGFWMKWVDNLIQVGRSTESKPFLEHKFIGIIPAKYIGILGYRDSADWIFHAEPKCGPYKIEAACEYQKVEADTSITTAGKIYSLTPNDPKETPFEVGKTVECAIRANKQISAVNDIKVSTPATFGYENNKFYPLAKDQKCISFELRGLPTPHLMLSAQPSVDQANSVEVLFQYGGDTSLMRINYYTKVAEYKASDIMNNNDYRGFWMKWVDNLIQVGRSTESKPFLEYKFTGTIPANYVAFSGYTQPADWILHAEPKCGPYEIKKSLEAACEYQKVKSDTSITTAGKVYSLTPNDPQETPFEVGKTVECAIRANKQISAVNDIKVSTPATFGYENNKFYPLAKDQKCISFELRGLPTPHLMLSAQPSVDQANSVEVLFQYGGDTSLMRINYYTKVAEYKASDIMNNNDYRGFWMKWVDNLIQVGRSTESKPFLEYKFTGTIPANYVAFSGYTQPADWILHAEPKCGPYEIKKSLEAACEYQKVKSDTSITTAGKVYSLTPNDPQETPFEVGKTVECAIRANKQISAVNDIKVSTPATFGYENNKFYPLAKDQKCISFELRGLPTPHLMLSAQPSVDQANSVEVLFQYGGDTSLMRINYYTKVAEYKASDIMNNNDYRGFWMKWVDNLIQVGRSTESKPFLEYKFTGTIPANYVAFSGYTQPADWILHAEPKCGPYEIKKSLEAACEYQKVKSDTSITTAGKVYSLTPNDPQETPFEVGKTVECAIRANKQISAVNDIKVSTPATFGYENNKFYPLAKDQKCISFELRGLPTPHLMLSAQPSVDQANSVEVLFQYGGDTSLMRINYYTKVAEYKASDIMNNNDYRGFWMKWVDNLIQVGRSTESKPFLEYKFTGTIPANYVAFSGYTQPADWILHAEPKCGPYEIKKSLEAACEYQKVKSDTSITTAGKVYSLTPNDPQETPFEVGKTVECAIRANKQISAVNDIKVSTPATFGYENNKFYPLAKDQKCISFELRGLPTPHLMLSAQPSVDQANSVEVLFQYGGDTSLMRINYYTKVAEYKASDIMNNNDYRGFWMKWVDNLIQVGRSTESKPFLEYKFTGTIPANYVAFSGYTQPADWILHAEPKCGPYEIKKSLEAACEYQKVKSDTSITTAGKVYSLTPNDPQETPFEVGKTVECAIRANKQISAVNDIKVSTPATFGYENNKFYPLAKDQKCISFELRGLPTPHLMLSAQPSVDQANSVEVLFQYGGDTSLMRINYYTKVAEYKASDIMNNNEYRGFWMKWVDNLIQVGRSTESKPFLEYKFTGTIPANYVAFSGYTQPADWILHAEPKCGPYEIKQTHLEAACNYKKV